MLLPCLEAHSDAVVPVVEALVLTPHEEGAVSEQLARAFSEASVYA